MNQDRLEHFSQPADDIDVVKKASLRGAAQETALHRAADAHVAKMSVALRYAFAIARKKLRGLLQTPGQLASYTSVVKVLHDALEEVIPSRILPMVVAGGQVGAHTLRTAEDFRAAKKTAKSIDFEFDVKSQAAIDWADRHAAELIDGITDTTRDSINNAVAEYLETGDWDTFTEDVLDAVGDEARADLIARHEPMLAASEGQRQAWDQAVEAGVLTGDERPTWIIVGDEKVCPICLGLDGKTRDLDGPYVGDDGEEYDGPPAHVRCRCTEGLT